MRYSILAGWLLLLLLPFAPIHSGRATIEPMEAVQFPARYLRAFHHSHHQWLSIKPLLSDPTETPVASPTGTTSTVKTWRDEKGVLHFSDTQNALGNATEKHIEIVDNSDLISPPTQTPLVAESMQDDALFMLVMFAISAILTSLIWLLLSAIYTACLRLLARHHSKGMDDEDKKPESLPAFEYQSSNAGDNPYAVLGISARASNHNVRAAYDQAIARHQTNQILHLTPAQQEAARIKARNIEQAWQHIRAERDL